MKILLFLMLVLTSSWASAQSNFIEICEKTKRTINKQEQLIKQDMRWLKHLFKVNECEEVASHLSKLTSFTQFVPHLNEDMNKISWVEEFPYLLGMGTKNEELLAFKEKEYGPFFMNMEIFSEFKNLTHTALSSLNFTPFCDVLNKLPQIKTISLKSHLGMSLDNLKCVEQKGLDVIVIGEFEPDAFINPKRFNIIGIEDYRGKIEDLVDYQDLRFLGIQTYDGTSSLEAFSSMINLTHLSFNISNLSDASQISYLNNLTYLKFNCFDLKDDSDSARIPDNFAERTIERCSETKLVDISFLAQLPWLEKLDLSGNNLEDLTPLQELSNLNTLKLRGNRISYFPNLISFEKMEYLDLAGNNLRDISFVARMKNLKFLNVSSNKLKDTSALSSLDQLKYLNLSNNPAESLFTLTPPESLEVLVANGTSRDLGETDKEFLAPLEHETSASSGEADFLNQILNGDFKISDDELYDENLFGLNGEMIPKFKNIKILSFQANDLKALPDLSAMSKLKYLNLNLNRLGPKLNALPLNLQYLKADHNKMTMLPDIAELPSIKKLSIKNNSIALNDQNLRSNSLEYLNLSSVGLTLLPDLKKLKQLKTLELSENNISNPRSVRLPPTLESINLSENQLTSIPDFSALKVLKKINLQKNKISDISKAKKLKADLWHLNLNHNQIRGISLFADKHFHHRFISVEYNPIERNTHMCPTDAPNVGIRTFCMSYMQHLDRESTDSRRKLPY